MKIASLAAGNVNLLVMHKKRLNTFNFFHLTGSCKNSSDIVMGEENKKHQKNRPVSSDGIH
jgi:hypothetical protein